MHKLAPKIIIAFVATMLPAIAIGLYAEGRSHLPTELAFIAILAQSSILTFGFGAPLYKVYFVFSYFFFGLAPYLEYKENIVYWGGAPISDISYFQTSSLVILLNFGFAIAYTLFKRKTVSVASNSNKKYEKLTLTNSQGLVVTGMVIFSSLAILLHINNYSVLSLIFRGGEHKELIELTGPTQTLIQSFFRFLPMVMFTAYLKFSHRPILPTLIFALAATVTASPLGMPRFMVAALYLPLLFVFFPSLLVGNKLPLLFFLSLAFIFPALNGFRNFNSIEDIKIGQSFNFLLEGHFDSYQSLARVIQENIITWGDQLLGVIFFFIPRTLWPEKPIGSGAEIAKQQGYEFSNVSANFYTEGYINFGLAGCFIFCIALAYSCSKLDGKWRNEAKNHSYFKIPYYSIVGYIFFVLRGDLLSSTANGISLFLANLLIFKLISRSSKIPAKQKPKNTFTKQNKLPKTSTTSDPINKIQSIHDT